uniref:Autophagy related 2A n=1 Tax=Electrophorus electricus TaxID=8005 RepID=A0A4W4G9J3_ELEEL
MSRWLFPWSGSIKKRACRYLLQHYLGHFLEERLSLEQLSLDLYNGSGVIKEINLDVWAVNELLESLGAPLEIVEGFVRSIAVTIPWAALVTDHCTLEVTGLQITCRPKYRTSWSSCMTSSMQLAQECLKDPPEASEEPPAPLEGLEMFAQTIETVLRRIKVTFLDTIVRIEHQPFDAETGVALEMQIKRLEYCDEAVRDSSQTVPVDIHQPPAFLHKILQLTSVQLLYETIGGPQVRAILNHKEWGMGFNIMFALYFLVCNYLVHVFQLELDGKVGCLHLLLSPTQIIHLTDLLTALCIETGYMFTLPLNTYHCLPVIQLSTEPYPAYLAGLHVCYPFYLHTHTHTHTHFAFHAPLFVEFLKAPGLFCCVGSSAHGGQSESMKPEALLRLSLGGVTLTLLEQEPPPGTEGLSPMAEVSQVFFHELAFFRDSMFSERDFKNLRGSFAKACPHSHLRYTHFLSLLLEMLRFPIPDLRPLGQRRPVCQRAVRTEVLTLDMSRLELRSQQGPASVSQEMPFASSAKLTQLLEATFSDMHGERADLAQTHTFCSMVIPADPEEMKEFQSLCVSQCQCEVEITLPVAYVLVPSKVAFQSIYNRINNDLLMWEPPIPPLTSSKSTPNLPQQQRSEDEFQLCKSAFRLESDSEEEEPQFCSPREPDKKKQPEPQLDYALSFLCLTVLIGKGRLQVMTDTKNEAGRRVEQCHGELLLDFEGGKIFSVTQHQNNPNLNFLTIESKKVELYHKGKVLLTPPTYLALIYLFYSAFALPQEFLVALRLQGATLRHHMAMTNHSWHEQLVDFLDVIDDDILGYTPPVIITVLHTHLATCAVDYRPLYLPLRVLLTAESFSLSSNIITRYKYSSEILICLYFAALNNNILLLIFFSSLPDYVCVLDIDLLELAITTWKGSDTGKLPLFDLRCSNNVVHVHTCADSCAALVNMLQYLVSQGDLHPPPRHTSPTEIAGQKLPRASPVSVYLFPGEAPKSHSSILEGEDLELDGLVATANEANVDMMSEEGSECSTDNDDFCILEAPGMGIPPKDGEPVVTVLCQGPIKVREGYFSRPRGSSDLLRAPAHFPVPQSRVVLREVSVVWHLYGGKDFGGARGSPSRSAGSSRPQNSWRWVGGNGRQHSLLMEIQLTKVSFQHESYPMVSSSAVPGQDAESASMGEQPLSRQVFIVQELEVRDRLASSQINKFLYLYTSESMPRRAHSNMLTVKALQVLPESGLGGPECCLRVSLLPLRLNIDQDALFFLKDFFSSMAAGVNPYLSVDIAAEVKADITQKQAEEVDHGSGLGPDLTASVETTYSEQSSSSAGSSSSSSDQPIYFREFRFTSEVPIWLDYHGKHVAIEQGTFAGILIGLAQLNCSELKLKRLCCRHGLLGVDKVIQYAVNEWLTDIRKNQLPGILGGVGPMHSVVQLFHGVRDLFWMPIEQYRRDGRIIRGLQRGAASFGTSTASAALELSNRLVQAIQATAETVYDILSPTPPLTRYITEGRPISRPRRTPQPADLREGVAKAYDTVREGVIDTAQTLCDVASRGHEQKGLPGAVGGVLRQIPPTVVRPLIVASEATSNLLGGMRNQIKPDARKEDFLKWRTEDSQE